MQDMQECGQVSLGALALRSTSYQSNSPMLTRMRALSPVVRSFPSRCPRLPLLITLTQPPAELIKELAPGLEFGADGMPLMTNMGPGMPGMPMPGMPFPGMGAGGQGLPLGPDGKPQCLVQ